MMSASANTILLFMAFLPSPTRYTLRISQIQCGVLMHWQMFKCERPPTWRPVDTSIIVSSGERHFAARLTEREAQADEADQHHCPCSWFGHRAGERQDFGEKLVADDVVSNIRRMDNKVIE